MEPLSMAQKALQELAPMSLPNLPSVSTSTISPFPVEGSTSFISLDNLAHTSY